MRKWLNKLLKGNRGKIIRNVALTIAAISVLGWFIYGWWPFSSPQSVVPIIDSCTNLLTSSKTGSGFIVTKSPEGKPEYIGVSDGSFIFDMNQKNKVQKCQGAVQFRHGDYEAAGKSWTEAVVLQDRKEFQQEESNDAEALIYRENGHVLSSGLPYITFIVGTILTGDDRGIGHDVLQGAYAAQEEFNRTHSDPRGTPLQICLFVANFSSNVVETPDVGRKVEDNVTRMIISIATKQRLNIKGVLLGLPFTFDNTINIFNQSKIPVVLSGAFSRPQLQNIKYVFPIASSTEHEGQIGAQYVQDYLKAKKIALFVNENSAYSKDLADAFQSTISNVNILTREIYTSRDSGTIGTGVSDALAKQADLIYFAGDLKDADVAIGVLEQKNANVRFMGGDAIYELGSYSGDRYKSLYFTSFAFPDEWSQLNVHQQLPFPTLYRLLYGGWPLNRTYGYLRPDSDAIVSYDALSVLLDASEVLFSWKRTDNFSLDDLQGALMNIKDAQAFQGFSGRISFGLNHDDKLVVVLYVNGVGLTRMVTKYGCLLVSCNPE